MCKIAFLLAGTNFLDWDRLVKVKAVAKAVTKARAKTATAAAKVVKAQAKAEDTQKVPKVASHYPSKAPTQEQAFSSHATHYSSSSASTGTPPNAADVTCYFCHQKGHYYKSQCPKWLALRSSSSY